MIFDVLVSNMFYPLVFGIFYVYRDLVGFCCCKFNTNAYSWPCVLLVVSQAITRGMSAALMCILGDVVGGAALMLLSLVGVGAILAASSTFLQSLNG